MQKLIFPDGWHLFQMDGTYSKNKVDLIETVKFSFDKPNIPTLRQTITSGKTHFNN